MPLPPLDIPTAASRALRAHVVPVIALAALAACSRGDAKGVTTTHADGESSRGVVQSIPDVPLPNLRPSTAPYEVAPVSGGGTVSGTVDLSVTPPADSAITPPPEVQRQCGATLVPRIVDAQGTRLAGVVVWLEGVQRGKGFPAVRRHEVSIEGCQLVPRVQAVALGGTLHVHSEDRLQSLLRVVRWPGADTAATVATNDDGEVVPNDRVLSKVGLLEIKGAQPPWLRAWVLVLDHPYVATTTATGAFSIDSVPPGQYKLVAWHERFGRQEQPVTVTAGQMATVSLRFGAPAAMPNGSPSAPRDTGGTRR